MKNKLIDPNFAPRIKFCVFHSPQVQPSTMPKSRRIKRKFDRSFWVDLIVRMVLALFFAFSAGAYTKNVLRDWQGADYAHVDIVMISHGAAVFATSFFTLMIAFLYVSAKTSGESIRWDSLASCGCGSGRVSDFRTALA